MLDLLLVIAAVGCALQVMRARRLIFVTLWLACTSALVATLLYRLGAHEVAVMELSVGAGLVTVLFVFAFSITGEVTQDLKSLVSRPLALALSLLVIMLLGTFILPLAASQDSPTSASFATVLWNQRGLDVLAQIVLIFSGVIGLLGLLSEKELAESQASRASIALAIGPANSDQDPESDYQPQPQEAPEEVLA